jgi:type IV secretory pathway TrbL component
MAHKTFGSRLKALFLALLNATLLLALLLVIGIWLLLGRAQDFAGDTAAMAASAAGAELREKAGAQLAGLGTAAERIKGVEARIDGAMTKVAAGDSAAAAELRGLRSDVQGLNATIGSARDKLAGFKSDANGSLRDALRELLMDLAARLGPAPAAS